MRKKPAKTVTKNRTTRLKIKPKENMAWFNLSHINYDDTMAYPHWDSMEKGIK